jgi:hypothetical protein
VVYRRPSPRAHKFKRSPFLDGLAAAWATDAAKTHEDRFWLFWKYRVLLYGGVYGSIVVFLILLFGLGSLINPSNRPTHVNVNQPTQSALAPPPRPAQPTQPTQPTFSTRPPSTASLPPAPTMPPHGPAPARFSKPGATQAAYMVDRRDCVFAAQRQTPSGAMGISPNVYLSCMRVRGYILDPNGPLVAPPSSEVHMQVVR